MSECPHCGAGPGEMCARLGFCKLTRDGSSPHTRDASPACECCGYERESVEDRTGPDGIGTLYLCDDCAEDMAQDDAERSAR